MKACEAGLLSFLKKSSQFVIPIYQRAYSWTERECAQLWQDIIRAGQNEDITVHFVGSIVYIEAELNQVMNSTPLLVIDGQQRLTTTTLLLTALAEAIGDNELLGDFSRTKIRNRYLIDPEESDQRRFKLILSDTDRDTLLHLVDNEPAPAEPSIRVQENYASFKKWLAGADLETVCRGVQKLGIVDISLKRGQDNPQLIFESMNSTGRELSQADLIRNFVLMGLEPTLQTRLYKTYWRPMELGFGQEAYGEYFDAFMRHYLTVKQGEIPNKNEVYDRFKEYSQTPAVREGGVEQLVADLKDFASYYCAMALGKEADPSLARAFKDVRDLKVEVAFPFLLEIYHDYANGSLSAEELEEIVRLVEAYVFRRAVCAIPTNSLNKTFSTFTKSLQKDRYLESIKAHFLTLPSYRRFPGDEEFRREFETRDLYHFRSRSYWLRRIENHNRKERVPVEEYTIEHILPQNPELSAAWRAELGDDWENVRERRLHTLGNLTLTGYNPEYSDHSFERKKTLEGGFAVSPLRLNEGLAQVQRWDEAAIDARAKRLSNLACTVWAMPSLPAEKLSEYRADPPQKQGYARSDHPYLNAPQVAPLFDRLRRDILALDPCVTEEFLKLYVAFKAETNFADVVPQASGLRISLNMKFAEIDDPAGICKDVTGIGRWGNGDVELRLTDLSDVPYVMGLIRQSLERQLGSAEAAE
jgi:uncharacterized protein with ParB-like and HNH nuclease domain/predicted transport protein